MTTRTPAASGVRYQVTIPGSTDELVELALHPHGAPRWLGTELGQVVGPFATFALPGDNYCRARDVTGSCQSSVDTRP
jgi:hypothetical protein